MTKEFKTYKILSFINIGCAALFSLLNLNFKADISLSALPLALVFTALNAYFVIYKAIIKTDGAKIYGIIKSTEYLPYVLMVSFILRRAGENGTPYVIDLIQVITWFVVFVLSYLTSRKLYEKRNENLVKGWAIPPKPLKFTGIRKVLFETVDWIDAIVWSIFTVLIFQIFFLQLYEIPSESMVPTFLIKDRVFVSKIECGPKFPLTEIGLPDLRKYKRGDTIVLRNPHYNMDRKSEVKSVTSNLVTMLTLTTVNINRDENGELKADPLVKRITGLPGEQLVMQDGTLYRRTKNSDIFEPVDVDNKYAAWNLNTINPKIKNKVQHYPLSPEDYNSMISFEEERRNYDLNVAAIEAQELVRKFNKLAFKDNLIGKFENKTLFEFELFKNVEDITRNLMCQEGGTKWFEEFMTSWIPSKNNIRDIYAESNYRLNVMSKMIFGNLVIKYAEFFVNGVSATEWKNDASFLSYYESAETLNWYIMSLLDLRNMPVFPKNDADGNPQYIPDNCYFMMGDNRFNSLDLRHSYDSVEKALTNDDPKSLTYYSMMAPQYVTKRLIVGKPIFRFWPLNRLGKV